MRKGNPDNLRQAAARKSTETTERAQAALRSMLKAGEPVNFQSVSRRAGCSDDFLYRHPELRPRIEQLRAQQRPRSAPAELPESPGGVARVLAQQLRELKKRHHAEVTELREALAVAHGELLELRRQLRVQKPAS